MIARTILEARIAEVREALRRARLLRHLAAAFAIGILVRGSFLLAALNGHALPKRWDRWSMLGLIVLCLVAWIKGRRNIWSDHEIARVIEQKHPSLDALLLTAIEHEPEADEPTGFLHERLIDHALARAATQNWPVTVANKPYTRALAAAWLAVIAFVATDVALRLNTPDQKSQIAQQAVETPSKPTAFEVTLTPGDAEVERGSRLIIEARFNGPVPADAMLIVSEPDGKIRDRLPMRLTVDEQVYGGLISKVDADTKYHVEFANQKSQEHTITVFDYPALVRADVIVTPPEYTKLPAKETKNTQKVTALEGSKIAWRIQVNKPLIAEVTSKSDPFSSHLVAAELFGEDKTIIPLTPSSEDPTVLEAVFTAEKSQKYRLHLVDEADRANKNPPWFKVTVQSNGLAKIEVVFPKRDLQVSSIQELPVEAKISDDLGVTKSGAVFSINGNSKEIIFRHPVTEPKQKQDVRAELTLETENAQPRQLVSYYLWAEDTGPKGEVRRAMSDMFFADVRHFEDIFREMEAPPSEPGEPKPKSDKLVDLVKQIVNATWRIIRDTNAGRTMDSAAPDVDVVDQSVGIALEQVKEGMEEAEDAEVKQALTEAWKALKDAQPPLQQASAEKKRSPINQALTFEQTALEWLHRAQSREHQVMRQNSPPQPGAGQQANKNQLMDLELKQQEKRYEEEKVATEAQSAEQQENLQVLNRLKELARRQEALAEKMKELQNQIAEAKTDEEKEELDNQLKRLQAEQEQLLRDLDDLNERMEKPENAENMAEAKEQLEQTREKVNEAVEQLKEEKLADAANSATRAQRELEKMQEDFRQKTSKKFADEVKQLREQAKEAAETQKKISEALENQKASADSDIAQSLQNAAQARQVAEQQENVEKLLNNMRELSEQAEQSEPLLHRNLYDAVRKAQTSGLEENLQETRDQLRYGSAADAKEAERQAANAVEELQKGVEKAAESVLGSESEALRVAKNELDKLIQEAQEQQAGEKGQPASDLSEKSDKSDAKSQKPGEKGDGEALDAKTAEKGEKPGKGQGEPQDPKMAENGQKPGEGQQGQKPGEKGQGQGQQQDPKTAQSGKQPGEGKDGQQPGEKGEGQGQKPGEKGQGQGEGKDPQMAEAGQQPGEGQQGQGQKPGEQGKGQGQGQQPGQGRGEGQQQTADADKTSQSGRGRSRSTNEGRDDNNFDPGGRTADRDSDNDRSRPQISGGAVPEALFFEDSKEEPDKGVFTGGGYDQWSDRLRNVEELLNNPELRNEAAKVLDRARELRINLKRSNEAPQVAVLNQRITQPLIELRDRVAEELSKKDAGKNLAPVDRDPVPAEFRDLVKRYYKELGAGK